MFLINCLCFYRLLLSLDVDSIVNLRFSLLSTNPSTVKFGELAQYSSIVGMYITIPIVLFILVSSILIFKKKTRMSFKKIYSMKSFREQELFNWPSIGPVVNKDMMKMDIDIGPWAMADSPMMYALKNNLGTVITSQGSKILKLDLDKTRETFMMQMGPRWNHRIDLQPAYIQALFAIFASKADRNTAASRKLAKQISMSAKTNKLDFFGNQRVTGKAYQK